jgi:hypothetical protein
MLRPNTGFPRAARLEGIGARLTGPRRARKRHYNLALAGISRPCFSHPPLFAYSSQTQPGRKLPFSSTQILARGSLSYKWAFLYNSHGNGRKRITRPRLRCQWSRHVTPLARIIHGLGVLVACCPTPTRSVSEVTDCAVLAYTSGWRWTPLYLAFHAPFTWMEFCRRRTCGATMSRNATPHI